MAASISNTQSITITSVVDYDPFYYYEYYYYYYSTNPKIVVSYTVVTNGGASIESQLAYSIQTGNFTSYLQYYATQNGATDLTTATSYQAEITSMGSPTAAPTSKPAAALSKDGIIAVVVVGFAVLVAAAFAVWWYCVRKPRSYSPNTVPQSESRATAVEMAVATPSSVSDPPSNLFNNPMKPVTISPPKTPPKPPKQNKALAKKAFQKGDTRDYI